MQSYDSTKTSDGAYEVVACRANKEMPVKVSQTAPYSKRQLATTTSGTGYLLDRLAIRAISANRDEILSCWAAKDE